MESSCVLGHSSRFCESEVKGTAPKDLEHGVALEKQKSGGKRNEVRDCTSVSAVCCFYLAFSLHKHKHWGNESTSEN